VHTCGAVGPSGVAGALSLCYQDGSEHTVYMQSGTQVTGWWFPHIRPANAGIAWRGPNPCSNDVGLGWAAVENPHPDRTIASVRLRASEEQAKYAVVALTLADRMPWHEPSPLSFGGPDNWAGGCCTLALIEGLAGIADNATAYSDITVSPRWVAAGVHAVKATARYGACDGYVSYVYRHDRAKRTVAVALTGSGVSRTVRVLLPPGAKDIRSATVNGAAADVVVERVERSKYAVVLADGPGVRWVVVRY